MSESGAVLGLASCDQRFDPSLPDEAAVLVVVVAAVGVDDVRAPAGPSDAAGDGRDAIEQRHELGDVVAVAGRGCVRQRQPVAVDEQVVLDA